MRYPNNNNDANFCVRRRTQNPIILNKIAN